MVETDFLSPFPLCSIHKIHEMLEILFAATLAFLVFSTCCPNDLHKIFKSVNNCKKDQSEKIKMKLLSNNSKFKTASVSVIAPFFPIEAANKGISASMAGYVFSVNGITLIIMNAIVGKILPFLGNKVGLSIGILLLGPANILFGLLDNINDSDYFITLCFITRILEAIGSAFITTTSFTTIMKLCPKNFSKEIAINETCVSMGFMFGPVIGSSLYAIGGYRLPFIVLGVAVLINLPLIVLLVKQYRKHDSSETETCVNDSQMSITYKKLISIFDIWLLCLINLMIAINFGSFEISFGLHLESYNIGPKLSGILFFIPSAAYGVGATFVGYQFTKTNRDNYFIYGLCTLTIGLLCIGPFSFYVIGPTLGASIFERFGYANLMTTIACMNLFVILITCWTANLSSPLECDRMGSSGSSSVIDDNEGEDSEAKTEESVVELLEDFCEIDDSEEAVGSGCSRLTASYLLRSNK
ncbi:MFS-type transporter-like protein [Leptotrombidium deliense]|uniref:MFS-type transporter-like protein n=1 Tax=Leptotrombidium deliense TaxID=299467 RepID=A0A443SR07_9ACAR|nr:MFS-type transporter-like protein [Leptotrombidium deliense]